MIQGIYLYGENKMAANTLILLGGMDWLEKSMQASGLVDVASVYKSRANCQAKCNTFEK